MLISKSERFLKEYNDFKSSASKISNDRIKTEVEKLITDLVFEVKSLDRKQEDLLIGRKVVDSLTEKKNKIADIRKKIYIKLQDCKKSGLIA